MKAFKFYLLGCFLLVQLMATAQNITGTVFNDSNNNGVKDTGEPGFPNAIVNAYLTGTTLVSTTTTSNLGTYTLTGLTAGTKYRLEFIPYAGFTDGALGSANLSSVQFINAGSSNVNFGIFIPGRCGTDPDPRLIGSCGLFPDPLNPPVTPPTVSVASWRYQTDFYPQTKWGAFNYPTVQPHQDDLHYTQVGVPWAMARKPSTDLVMMVPISSPETSVFGTGGTSGLTAIYVADYSGPNAGISSHKTLVQLSSLGFSTAAQNPIGAVQPRFGEYGLGGIAISPDGNSLFVANLGKGNIIKINISNVNYASLPATAPVAGDISEISFPSTIAGFTQGTDGFFRATAMKTYAGDVYISGTFDGSLRGDNSAVRIVVFKLNPTTNALTEVFSYNPTLFNVGNLQTVGLIQTRWTAGPDVNGGVAGYKDLQPVVSGFDFDNYGAITLGITNRAVYNLNTANETGYVISTWRNANGTYTLENDGIRGPLSQVNDGTTMHGLFNTGPGGDLFYDQSIGHPYIFSGGLLNVTGKNVMAMGVTDPLMVQSFGVRYDGQSDGGILGGIGLGGGKLFALVGVDAVCQINDPVEVGNYVWRDSNDNGIQDGNELPLENVTVQLLNSSGTVIATATTDPSGYYVFSSDPNRTSTASHRYQLTFTPGANYTIRIPNISGGSQQSALSGLFLTVKDQGTDVNDSDGSAVAANADVTFVMGTEGQNNHTYDFGFGTTPSCVISIACNGTNTTCGLINGSISTTLTGNAGVVSYLWSNSATTSDITGVGAGTYTVTVTEGACTATCSAAIVSSVATTVTCAKTDNTNCASPNGTATATATGVTYVWSNSATTATINNLAAGTYTVTVTSTTTGCTATCQAIVASTTTPPTAVCTPVANTNCATPNGSASVSTNAANPTYLWSTGGTGSSISNLAAGTYTVTVTDPLTSCVNSCQAVVTSTATPPTVTCAKTDNTNCASPNGTATATATGVTYVWSNSATTATINNLAAGTYTVTVTSTTTGCTATCQAIVASTTTPPTAVCTPVANTNCATPNGSASVSTSAANPTYVWSTGGTGSSISNLAAGTYTVTVTDPLTSCVNSCQTVVITNTTPPTLSVNINTQNTSCTTPNGSISTVTNAVNPTYVWSNGATTSGLTNLSAGTFTVTVTDGTTGCNNTGQAVITNPLSPTCSLTATAHPSCLNLTAGSISAQGSGGQSPYSFAWSNGASGPSASGLTGGTYTVTVTDAGNCTSTCQVTLDTPMNCCNINVIVPQNVVCLDNGTPNLHTDNRIRFSANVTNTNLSLTGYNVTINGGTTITPNANVPYGVTQFILGARYSRWWRDIYRSQ
jgi:hypothetical protein